MPSAPIVRQYFRMHGQTDTDSDTVQVDVHMEPAEQLRQPVAETASAVPVTNWPPMDDASVNAERRRTARKQQRRRAQRFEAGEERLRQFGGNAFNRAHPRINAFPAIFISDSRAPPSRPSSSTDVLTTPQRSTAPNPSISRRAAPSPSRAADARNVRPRSDIPDADLPEHGTGGMERLARISNQATYAAATLKGKTDLGKFAGPFIESVRRDLTQYSIVSENSFLVEFMRKRSQDIL